MSLAILPDIEISVPLLVSISLCLGVITGFAGVGGGFFMTPTLIILGFPAEYAVGTSLAWIAVNATVGVFKHRKLGNIDVKLGIVIILAALGGVEIGVKIINWAKGAGLADEIVLRLSICMLIIVGTVTLMESIKSKRTLDRKVQNGEQLPEDIKSASLSARIHQIKIPPMINFPKSQVRISLWVLLLIGTFTGVIIGTIGVGGGFILMPSFIYLIGLTSFMALGTDLFQIMFSASYGGIRHFMNGDVLMPAFLIMIFSSIAGVYFGASITKCIHGIVVRYVLSAAILSAATSAILRLLSTQIESVRSTLESAAIIVLLSGIGLSIGIILAMLFMGVRIQRQLSVPAWVKPLLRKID